MNKAIKKCLAVVSAIAITGCMLFSFTGCKKSKKGEEGAIDPADLTNIDVNHKYTSASEVAGVFVNALLDKNYALAATLIDVPEGAIVSGEDIRWCVERNENLKEVLDFDDTHSAYIVSEKEDSSYMVESVGIYDAGQDKQATVTLGCLLTDTHYWKIDFSDYVLSDWQIEATGGAKLYLDDIEVPTSYITEQSQQFGTNTYVVYTIPAILCKPKEAKLVSDAFGEYVQTVPVDAGNSVFNSADASALYIPPEDEKQKMLDFIRSSWNDMYSQNAAGAGAACVRPYMSKYSYASDASGIVEGFNILNYGGERSNFNMVNIIQSAEVGTYYITGSLVWVNFGYSMECAEEGYIRNMTKYSSIVLSREDDGYKIFYVSDDELYSYYRSGYKQF